MMPAGDELHFDWRRGGAAAGGLIAALILVVMVILVALSNDARERALEDERRAYNVALLVRGVDASMSRAEAALGRFMLDEDIRVSGSIYYSQWRLAGHQISQLERLLRANPEQRRRVNELLQLYAQRGAELAPAGRAAATKQGQDAISWYYAAGEAETDEDVTRKLDEIADAERTQELQDANEALRAEAVERQLAEAQLRQVQKMEAVGQLTGGIAHDFNNMLAVVVGGIDLARRRLNGPKREVMAHLTNAMEGATRAAALTRRLLSFARSEPLLPERVDSGDLVACMSDLLDWTLGERIRVDVDLTPGT